MYAKAETLQAAVQSKRQQGVIQPPEQEQLQRINALIRAYEDIVEGNYIDNLIRAEKECTEALTRPDGQPKTAQTNNRKPKR